MTDLSKDLGEIKRRGKWDAEAISEGAEFGLHNTTLINDRAALLHIIEVQIPGMLRARAELLESESAQYEKHNLDLGQAVSDSCAVELRNAATLIESLTKDKEKEKG